MATKARITDKGMQAKPGPVDQWLTSPFARGAGVLTGRIRPTGERLFYFRYTDAKGGRPFLPLGSYHPQGKGGLTLAQARDEADRLSRIYVAGHRDLKEHLAQVCEDRRRAEEDARAQAEVERAAREEAAAAAAAAAERRVTIHKLFDQWRDAELRPQVLANGARTGRKDNGAFTFEQFTRRVFPVVGKMAAEDVRKADLMAILDAAKRDGRRRTANVLLSDMRQMFRFAVDREIVQRNPLDGIKKSVVGGQDVQRERFLADDEIRHLVRLLPLADLSPRSMSAIWLALATGARVGEIMGAVWSDSLPADPVGAQKRLQVLQAENEDVKVGVVDLVARTWYLPTSKNQRDHTIHLSEFALAQFERLAAQREVRANGDSVPWVFPNIAGNGPVGVKTFGKLLADRQRAPERRISGRSKNTQALLLPGGKWTAHDLRRTTGTLMASLGISGDVIDECLNHVIESRVRRTYVRDRRPVEQARAFDALGAKLAELTTQGLTPVSATPTLRLVAA